MFNKYNIKSCSTINELTQYGEALAISMDKLHTKKVLTRSDGTKVVFNYLSILDKYYDYLNDLAVTVKLSDDEYAKYKYKPKLLCYDVYNNLDMAPLILRLNHMTSVTDFTKQEIRMFKTDIFSTLNEIFILEQEAIDNNTIEVEKEIRR